MNERVRQVIPHVIAMIILYGVFLTIAAAVFGYDDFWAAFTIGVAVIFGYKPFVVALGLAPDHWAETVDNNEDRS